ncbi:MAG: phasin family protein, partial [Actinomycetota bacterium]|nr:phasin family protein [Actinomycetota bacterium]
MDDRTHDAEGLGDLTRRTAEALVRTLVRQGEATADRAEQLVTEVLARSERNRDALLGMVRAEVERTVDRLGLVRREELERLAARVASLDR